MVATASAQSCLDKNLYYYQAFPAGGESDLPARHQQPVLKKKCPRIETIIQYKPGAGGGLMWAQMNGLPADGYNIVGFSRLSSGGLRSADPPCDHCMVMAGRKSDAPSAACVHLNAILRAGPVNSRMCIPVPARSTI